MILDTETRSLLKEKLEKSQALRARKQEDKERKRIAENIDDFYGNYRFADETESAKIRKFLGKTDFSSPAHIQISHKAETTIHNNMYLCFLCGSEELLKIYISGNHKDLMSDLDNWDLLSPYLLLIDEDFNRYIYINDNGERIESSL